MRSISVLYFIRMKTGGIFYFCELLLQTLENQHSPLCNKGKTFEVYLKNALYTPHIFFSQMPGLPDRCERHLFDASQDI